MTKLHFNYLRQYTPEFERTDEIIGGNHVIIAIQTIGANARTAALNEKTYGAYAAGT